MQTLFDKFGGTRPMADHLGEPPSTVQSWKTAGRVPAAKQPDVLAKAEVLGLDVTAEDVIFPLGRVAICSACDMRAEAPAVRSCTRTDCPIRVVEHQRAEAA